VDKLKLALRLLELAVVEEGAVGDASPVEDGTPWTTLLADSPM
jgi:hypothetical protein